MPLDWCNTAQGPARQFDRVQRATSRPQEPSMFSAKFTARRLTTTTVICVSLLVSASVLPGSADAAASGHRHSVVSRGAGHPYVLLGPSVFGVTVQQDRLRYSAEARDDASVRGKWRYRYF